MHTLQPLSCFSEGTGDGADGIPRRERQAVQGFPSRKRPPPVAAADHAPAPARRGRGWAVAGISRVLAATLCIALWQSRPCRAATALDFAALIKLEKQKLSAQAAVGPAAGVLEFPRRTLASEAAMVPGAPPNVWYVPDFVSVEEEEGLLRAVGEDPMPWTDLGKRRLRHYGGVPDPSSGAGMVREPMPPFMGEVCRAVAECGVWSAPGPPNQVLCNEYDAGGGIGKHLDGPLFYPLAGVLSLGTQAVIEFSPCEGGGAPCRVLLMPRSLLLFSRDAYLRFRHEIEPRGADTPPYLNGAALPRGLPAEMPRGRRVSLTVRCVEIVADEDAVIISQAAEEERRRKRAQFERGVKETGGGL